MEKHEKEKKKLGLSTKIFIALLTGAVGGVLIHYYMPEGYFRDTILINGILYVLGNGFIRLMQMLVVPLVFCSLVCGAMAIGDTKTLGTVGVKTILFYLCTTALAICVALGIASLINPGVGLNIALPEDATAEYYSEKYFYLSVHRRYAADHLLCFICWHSSGCHGQPGLHCGELFQSVQ